MNRVDAPSEPDQFCPGDSVAYRSKIDPTERMHWSEGHILAPGFMTDDDGDSEPYKVYPVQVQGGRGVGGFWPADSIIPNPESKEPTWPIT